MLLLVGSSIIFSSSLVQQAADKVESSFLADIGITDQVQQMEIVFWTSILAALGASVLILIQIFQKFTLYGLEEFLSQLGYDRTKTILE